MSMFRRVIMKKNEGRDPFWRAEVYDEGRGRFRWVTLFPKKDERARSPETVKNRVLAGGWAKIKAGS